jgi:phosphatidylinositol alpha 1,6-mannosyltransferase
VVEHLERRHHEALVVAPGCGPSSYSRTPVERVPAVEVPLYRSLSVGLPTRRVRSIIAGFRPDVVHLAAPTVLGAVGVKAARSVGVPSVAVYQTDLAGFGARYGLGFMSETVWKALRHIHNQANLTLAPSTSAAWMLRTHGIARVARWGRGVDLERFNPVHRSSALRRRLAPHGDLLVGYVGRLAAEKQVHLLHHAAGVAGTRTVVVGDGPSAHQLRHALPRAIFVGTKTGSELSAHFASLDVFVHTGPNETFCQAIQEALASGVPVVAPAAGGPLDTVHHGDNGFVYPPGQPQLMGEAVRDLVRFPVLRAEMGRRARQSVLGRDWPSIGDELLSHYQQVIDSAAGVQVAA